MLVLKNVRDSPVYSIADTMADAFIQQDIPVSMVPNSTKNSTSIHNLFVEFCIGLFLKFSIYSSIAKGVPILVFGLF